MKPIDISRTRFIEELATMVASWGCKDWALYATDDGCVQARHSSYSNPEGIEYYKIMSLRNMADVCDSSGRYVGDKRFDNWEVASWVADEYNFNNGEVRFEYRNKRGNKS